MELSQLTAVEASAHEVMTFTGFDGMHLGSISQHTTQSGLTIQHLGPSGEVLDEELVTLTHETAIDRILEDFAEEGIPTTEEDISAEEAGEDELSPEEEVQAYLEREEMIRRVDEFIARRSSS